MSAFPKPQISGHEIVGNVVRVGSDVTNVKIGDNVGVGWQRISCHNCEWCNKGQENLCAQNMGTCTLGAQGGFSDKWAGDSKFCFKIPDGLPLKYVGPLMCGGITVFSPMKRFVEPGMNVGVLGIGGLGHMAIKFAKAKGCRVTAFSRSDSKREDTLKIGADIYVNTSSPDELKAAENTLDYLIITINAAVDWDPYMAAMRPNGAIAFVGAIPKPIEIPVFGILMKNLIIAGSNIGGSENMKEMLQFAADHAETCMPMVETMPMEKINEALERVENNDVRFRMVVEN
jgi:uncharacterized zinc-type alcohol dehydrogenase-like protein